MNITSALNHTILGIQRGFAEADRNAALIASGQEGVVEPLVGLLQSEHQVQASASALRIIDETLGSLLDITA